MLEVGRVARAHGVRGDVLIKFTTDRVAERTAPKTVLHIDDHSYTVTNARPHQSQWLVTLAEVGSREQADALRGKLVSADPLEVAPDDDSIFVHQVIGANMVDQHGVDHGQVVSVIDNPASDLMELANGRMVPFAFLVSLVDGIVNVDTPVGLLDDGAVSERDAEPGPAEHSQGS